MKDLNRPKKEDYDFNDNIEGVRYAKDMNDYADKLEKQLRLYGVGNSFAWEEVEEFGRQAFYNGREVERYNENGLAIFKRPTYNGYLRELDSK
jgi:hypothetical protein